MAATKRKLYVQFAFPSTATPKDRDTGLLLEQLRYAGLLVYCQKPLAAGEGYIIAFPAPKGVDQDYWCAQQRDRMKTFGIKAEVVSDRDTVRGL